MGKGIPKVEWPNGARIAVVMQVPFEQFSKGPHHGGSLVNVPILPEEVVRAGQEDLLFESWQQYAEVGMWRIAELLDRHEITAMGVFSGLSVERYPEATKHFVSGGKVRREACAHSWAQDIPTYALSSDQMRENIRKTVAVFERVLETRPVGWVSPGGQFKRDTPRLLADQGFIYHDDYANNDCVFPIDVGENRKFVGMSIPWDTNDTMHNQHGGSVSRYVELFSRAFDVLYEEGGQILGAVAHTATYGRPYGVWAYDQVIRYAKGHPKVWFTNRREIAEWYIKKYL